jgi:hypothetical protein
MGTNGNRPPSEPASAAPPREETLGTEALLQRLNLPEEVTTQQAAILGCCKHTVLHYLEQWLLEWRNASPPCSPRPVYRLTLRSVLALRLGYQRGSPPPLQPVAPKKERRKAAAPPDYTPKHVRRKKPPVQDDRGTPSS